MILLSTDWAQAWTMAGISVGVVFIILILLVLVLYVFNFVAAPKQDAPAKPKVLTGAEYVKSKQADIANASDLDKVALATAVYLYLGNQHDEESGILTIHHTDHPAWHAELNKHL